MKETSVSSEIPRLSLVTIVYKDAAGLLMNLQSVRQLADAMGSSFEQIVVDSSPEVHGDSIDRSDFPWVRWTETPPTGIYSAINFGTRVARGRFIWHLHAGDRLVSSSTLMKALECLEGNPSAFFLYSPRWLTFNGQPFDRSRPLSNFRSTVIADRTDHPGMIFCREFFDKIGHFNEKYRIAADLDICVRAVNASLPYVYFEEPFVAFDMSGISTKGSKALLEEVRQIEKQISPMSAFLAAFLWLRYQVRLVKYHLRLAKIKDHRWVQPLRRLFRRSTSHLFSIFEFIPKFK